MLPETFTPQFLKQLELLTIHSRRAFLGTKQGGHVSLKRGHGIEFSDYRQYELGDNPRHIDWGVYARSDRLYIKRFQEEQDISLLVVLDTSASMVTPPQDRKWQRARDIALALAYVALLEQDTALVIPFKSKPQPALYGARAIHSAAQSLSQLKLGEVIDYVSEMRQAASRVRFPGIAVVISDFLVPFETIQSMFMPLQAKNLQITAIQVLGQSDIEPQFSDELTTVIDSESGEEVEVGAGPDAQLDYSHYLTEHNQRIETYLKSRGINFASGSTNQPLSDFIFESIARTGLLK